MTKEIPTLILGIGNILWADEGFGVRAVEEFHKSYAVLDPADKVIDGGTLGMYLFDDICRCDKLLVFDCCDFHGKPGELRVLHDKEISIWTSTKLSPHQDGMNDLLAAAHLRLSAPNQIIVVGFQPVLLDDYGGSLSNEDKKPLGPAVEAAFKELKNWGVPLRERTLNESYEPLNENSALNMERYEAERPSQEEADRTGDRRYAFIRTNEA